MNPQFINDEPIPVQFINRGTPEGAMRGWETRRGGAPAIRQKPPGAPAAPKAPKAAAPAPAAPKPTAGPKKLFGGAAMAHARKVAASQAPPEEPKPKKLTGGALMAHNRKVLQTTPPSSGPSDSDVKKVNDEAAGVSKADPKKAQFHDMLSQQHMDTANSRLKQARSMAPGKERSAIEKEASIHQKIALAHAGSAVAWRGNKSEPMHREAAKAHKDVAKEYGDVRNKTEARRHGQWADSHTSAAVKAPRGSSGHGGGHGGMSHGAKMALGAAAIIGGITAASIISGKHHGRETATHH